MCFLPAYKIKTVPWKEDGFGTPIKRILILNDFLLCYYTIAAYSHNIETGSKTHNIERLGLAAIR